MLTLPSLWNIVISTLVFFIAVYYIRRYLDEQGLPKGMTRSLLVFMLAYLLAWGAGEIADWVDAKIEGPQTEVQSTEEVTQLLKALEQKQQ
jgi:membrane protein required for beta-lactamase induction